MGVYLTLGILLVAVVGWFVAELVMSIVGTGRSR